MSRLLRLRASRCIGRDHISLLVIAGLACLLSSTPAAAYRVSIDGYALADTVNKDAVVDDPGLLSGEVLSLSTSAAATQTDVLNMSATSTVSGTSRIGQFSGSLRVVATSSSDPDASAAALGQTELAMTWEDSVVITGPGGPGTPYSFAATLNLVGGLTNTANIPGSTASIFSSLAFQSTGMSVYDILEIGSRQTQLTQQVTINAAVGQTITFFARSLVQATGGAYAGLSSASIVADFPHTIEFFLVPLDGGGYTSGSGVAFAPTEVPEPSTYALMLAGLGLLGFMARRRRA